MKKLMIAILLMHTGVKAQQISKYNLADLFTKDQMAYGPGNETHVLENSMQNAVTTKGIVWLKGIDFTKGTIDIDLRGKDEFLKSFLGIAFHGIDTTHCDILYFRPFNFKHADTARRRWAVAYMSLPDSNYAVLRKAFPLVYENAVTPVPDPADWFHATIVIEEKKLRVFVNHAAKASLEVTLIGNRSSGLFGLYSDGLTNDFANLVISQ